MKRQNPAATMNEQQDKFMTQCLERFELKSTAIMLTDLETGKIVYVNAAFEKLFNIPRVDAAGKDTLELGLATAETRSKLGAMIRNNGSLRGWPMQIQRTNHVMIEVLLTTEILEIDNKPYFLSKIVDVTDMLLHEDGFAQLAAIVDYSDIAIVALGLDAVIKSWNKGAEKIFGYAASEAIGKSTDAIIPVEYRAMEAAMLARLINGDEIPQFETVRVRKNGERFHVALSISPLKDRAGSIVGISKITRDITEQKQAAYARNLIEVSLDPLVTISAAGTITDVNQASINVTGISREQLIGTDFSDYFTDPQLAQAGYEQVFEKGFVADYPLTIRHADGHLTDVLYNASVYKDAEGVVLGVFAAARDITAQKQSSQYARSLLEASLDPLVTIDSHGKIMDVNEASIRVTGVSREQLIGTDFSDYFTEPYKAQAGYKQVFDQGSVADYPLTIKHADGHLTDVLYNASVYKDAEGVVLGVFAAARDITAQKQSSQYARSLLEASLDPLVTIDSLGKIMDVNEASVNATGMARAALIGTDFSDYFTDPQLAQAGYEQVFEKGFVADYPLTIKHALGDLMDVMYNASVYKDAEGVVLGVFAAARDVTEQKWAIDLRIANKELAFQNDEKEKRAEELVIANQELAFQNDEKEKRANELAIANKELAYQNDEKEQRANELAVANNELAFQNTEKEKRAAELAVANTELAFQSEVKEKRAAELVVANLELAFQNQEKEKRAAELAIANVELAFQSEVKEKRAGELAIANVELAFQNGEKEKRAAELVIANEELAYQSEVKERRAAELVIANKELVFQNQEKEQRAAELALANEELAFQSAEKEKRAAELAIANIELAFQNDEKGKRVAELRIANYARGLIEASLDPLVTINASGKITDLNAATVHATGIARELLIGSDFLDYFTEPQKAREVYEEIFAQGSVVDSPLILRHKDGTLTDVLFNGSVYKDDLGIVQGVVIVARDVTERKKIEAILAKSLQEISGYKMALDESSIVAVTDQRGIINYANDNFCKISGYSREELIGSDHRLIRSGFHPKAFMAELWKTIGEGKIWTGEIKNRAKNGTIYWVDTTIVPFMNAQGEIYQYVAIRQDITARKLLLQYSMSLIEASRDALITISPEGKITDMNEAMVMVTGKSRAELRGSDFKNYFTDPQKAMEVYQEVFAKGFVADYPLTIIDHKLTVVLFNGSVYKDDTGNVVGAVIVARDITEQNRVQKELTEAIVFAELATEFAEQAKARAEEATETATNAVKAKQQFLSNMSHEIRTPMNAIIGFTKVLLKTELSSKQKEYLSAIKMSGDALIVLINDILDLAKVDAGKMTFERIPFKMAASITSMLHLFEAKIQEKNIGLEIDHDVRIPNVILGDAVRLHQIILNLVSNAVKFTNQGKISVRTRLVEEDETSVQIELSVIDTGIGIVPSKIDSIFENFQQASSSTSRLFGGTGLGLAIVKQLVEQQGGTTHVVSQEDVGSTFSFTLTFGKTQSEAEAMLQVIELDPDFKNIKVLVVEDMALNQLLMRTLLDDFGFDRDIAANGQIAIEKLQSKSYDIILMDLQMPVMNGFEATAYIRNVLHSKIPIIALTADVTTVDLAKCNEVGMDDYLAKPIDERLLYTKILSHVKKPMSRMKEMPDIAMPMLIDDSKLRCIDLAYLSARTKANPDLMMEMISIYIEQTPPLVVAMRQGLIDQDWQGLHAAVHKMIPSFAIMGIGVEFETMAKRVQEYANSQQQSDSIHELVAELGRVCEQACLELEEELRRIRTTK